LSKGRGKKNRKEVYSDEPKKRKPPKEKTSHHRAFSPKEQRPIASKDTRTRGKTDEGDSNRKILGVAF